jgi:hypothetical protein
VQRQTDFPSRPSITSSRGCGSDSGKEAKEKRDSEMTRRGQVGSVNFLDRCYDVRGEDVLFLSGSWSELVYH